MKNSFFDVSFSVFKYGKNLDSNQARQIFFRFGLFNLFWPNCFLLNCLFCKLAELFLSQLITL